MKIVLLISVFAILLFLGCHSVKAFTKKTPPLILEKEITLLTDEKGHIGFPDITKLPGGQLILVYRQGKKHSDPSGKIMKIEGSADGYQWSTPSIVIDSPDVDERDPSLLVTAEGDLILSFFNYYAWGLKIGVFIYHKTYTARSVNRGQSFDEAKPVFPHKFDFSDININDKGLWVDGKGAEIMVDAVTSPAIQKDGRLILPVYRGNSLNLNNLAEAPRSSLMLFESNDQGRSWIPRPLVHGNEENLWLMEPSILPLEDGKLMIHFRTSAENDPGGVGDMMQWIIPAEETPGAWTPLGFAGHAPCLVRIKNGVLLSVFREVDSAGTYEWVSYIASMDEGATWSKPYRITEPGRTDCGYPSLVELEENRILIVYYDDDGHSIKGRFYRPGI